MIMDTYTDCFARPSQQDWENMEGRGDSPLLEALMSEEQTRVSTRVGNANHYFREKKWEFFPELAPIPSNTSSIRPNTPKAGARNCREPSSKQPQSVNPNATSISACIQKAFSERTSKFKAVRRCKSTEISMSPTSDRRTPVDRERASSLRLNADAGGNDIASCTPPPRKQQLVPMTPQQKESDRREGGQAQRRPAQIISPKGFPEKSPGRPSKGNAKQTRPEEPYDIHISRSAVATAAAPFSKARTRSTTPHVTSGPYRVLGPVD